ncbi:DUF4349 domain-containing protein [Halovulum sp. GXIMD14793]
MLFALRLGYGYITQPNGQLIHGSQGLYQSNVGYDFALNRRNYAGQKGGAKGGINSAGPLSVDQRYEKIATLGMTSGTFTEDEASVRQIAKDVEALIQHEQAYGLTGQRRLQLALGVPPEAFDDTIVKIREIGNLVSFQVNKTDKTNEYRALLAKQESLEKSRDNLAELKTRKANIRDLSAIENRILELENQIQALGVSVGEFDSEFEFVTIKMTLTEVGPKQFTHISLIHRSKVAFEWAVKAILMLTAGFFFLTFGLMMLTVLFRFARQMLDTADTS